jgi:segregation and condensation protein B
MAHMRLVTHEQLELEDEMFGDDDEPMDAAAEATDADASDADVRDRSEDEAADAESAEHPDGAVEDAGGESSGAAEARAADIDLALLEALLFSTHHPLTAGRLAELIELDSTKPIRKAIKDLNVQFVDSGRSFRIEQVAGGYLLLTLPQFGDALKRLHQKEADAKLTKAALETLAIIAYKQPILRADVEAIRGVACGETIRSLMEKHLVKIAGRAEEPGRPILYGTTKRFLELFGLNSLKDLPQGEGATLTPQA